MCELGVPTLVPWLSRERRRSRPRTGPAAVWVVSGGSCRIRRVRTMTAPCNETPITNMTPSSSGDG